MSGCQRLSFPGNRAAVRIPSWRWETAEGGWILDGEAACDVRGLTRTRSGDVLAVVRRGGEEILLRSADKGATWNRDLDFNALPGWTGGMTDGWTTLESGRIIGVLSRPGFGKLRLEEAPYEYGPIGRNPLRPYVYEHLNGLTQSARCAYSDDNGRTWSLTAPMPLPEKRELRPHYGRIAELPDHSLLVTGHVFATLADQRDWIFSPCILRSTDEGMTWSDPEIVARGEPDIGNCYNELGLLALGGDRLLAFWRMNPVHYGMTLYGFRSFSADAGRTWTPPEQCLQGPAEMDLLHLPGGGIMITGVSLSGVLYTVSFDQGLTWAYQGHIYDKHPKEKAWDWHYSYTVELDAETLLTVYSRQNEKGVFGVYKQFLRRRPGVPPAPGRDRYRPPAAPASRWVLRERRFIHDGPEPAVDPQICRLPDGELLVSMQLGQPARRTVVRASADAGVTWSAPRPVAEAATLAAADSRGLTALAGGRILLPWAEYTATEGTYERAGDSLPGRAHFDVSGFSCRSVLRVAVSDDKGSNWRLTDPIVAAPFLAARPAGRIVALPDGSLMLPVFGPVCAADMERGLDSCGIFRSADGGATWRFFAMAGRARQDDGVAYRRASVLPQANGDLLIAMGTHTPYRGPRAERHVSFACSSDRGRTWSTPRPLWPGWDPLLAQLPGGSLFCAQAVWTGLKFEVSDNGGITWAYQDQLYYRDPRQEWGGAAPSLAVLDSDTALAVYRCPNGRVDASWLRRVPADSALARARFE